MFKISEKKGFTLVEVVITLILLGAFSMALITVYTYGVERYQEISSKYKMYEETAWILEEMEEVISAGYLADITSSRLTIHIPDISGDDIGSGRIEFFLNSRDHTLRMNDRRVGYNKFNVRLLPYSTRTTRRRFDNQNLAFELTSVNFEFADFRERSIKIDLEVAVETDTVHTMNLSTTAFLENK